jgi:hypothetical protein
MKIKWFGGLQYRNFKNLNNQNKMSLLFKRWKYWNTKTLFSIYKFVLILLA